MCSYDIRDRRSRLGPLAFAMTNGSCSGILRSTDASFSCMFHAFGCPRPSSKRRLLCIVTGFPRRREFTGSNLTLMVVRRRVGSFACLWAQLSAKPTLASSSDRPTGVRTTSTMLNVRAPAGGHRFRSHRQRSHTLLEKVPVQLSKPRGFYRRR